MTSSPTHKKQSTWKQNPHNPKRRRRKIDGQPKHFTVRYLSRTATNGGYMFDVALSHGGEDSRHRVVVGREYYEPAGLSPELPVEAALGVVLQLKLPRARAPGAPVPSSRFPAAYFAVSSAEQCEQLGGF